MGAEGETVGLSAVLVTVTSVLRTVTAATGVDTLSLHDALPISVLETVPLGQGPVAPVVGLVTWTEVVAPAARFAGANASTPAMIGQRGSALARLQLRPALVGRVSEAVTPWAVHVPPLWTVTV